MAAMVGMAQSTFMPTFTSLLLDASPAAMRGRVMGLIGFDRAMVSLGASAAGFAAAALGPQVALLAFGGVCVAVAAVLFAMYPPIRHID